jgi:sugar-specific transcriptional regulator TrmB
MLDLTPFGFTPTESLVYEVLITKGPGTGYAVARAAGLARANAYSALEGLVAKGAARADEGKPRRYRPEPPAVVLGRIVDRQGQAVELLARALDAVALPPSPTLTEVTSLRGMAQLLSLEIARAQDEVRLFLPAEAYALLGPALRRAAASGVRLDLGCDTLPDASPVPVRQTDVGDRWPGRPLLAAIDRKAALVGTYDGDRVTGHWGVAPSLVAAVLLALSQLSAGSSGGA